MNANVYNASMLPRFILGGSHLDEADSDFVVHLHHPRFVMRVNEESSASADVQFIDPPEPMEVAAMMSAAGDFYAAESQIIEEDL